ncbi:MAG: leucine-rich repeat domain-containing protein [Saprospiraceae bacterium]
MKIKFSIYALFFTALMFMVSCDTKTKKSDAEEVTTEANTDTCNYDFTIKVNPKKLQLSNLTNLNVELTNGNVEVKGGKVQLKRQQLEILPKEILNYDCIHTFNLSRNSISKFPIEVFKMEKLKKIDLSDNSISKFPSISETSNLETLNLNANKISVIKGADLLKFKNLKNLFLEGNSKLADLPEEITQMTNLKSLDLRGTKLGKSYTKIRKLMKDMPNTKIFYR